MSEGTLLASRYEVQAFVGEGSFGKVAKCVDTITDNKLAVKITKDQPYVLLQALEEIKILRRLQTVDEDKCNFVKWDGLFLHEQFVCLKFELLDLSLFDYMEERKFLSLSLSEVRPILHQITTALLHLEELKIIHADLKPDNIMIADRRQESLRVKMIDFGLARHVSKATQGSLVQSLWYRAPEIMLGLTFAEPIDMWSLGLIAADIALGFTLFPGHHEYDMLKFFVDTLGQPPDYLLNFGQRSSDFFKLVGSDNEEIWRLKTPEEFAMQTGHKYKDTRQFNISSLDGLQNMMSFRDKAGKKELLNFIDLLRNMLAMDKNCRIVPQVVLEHPFFFKEDTNISHNTEDLTASVEEASTCENVNCTGNISAEPVDNAAETEPEPEITVNTTRRGGRVRRFFRRMGTAVVSLFRCGR
ncbi:homeodomain-interacting protein kinase 3-like [Scomber scombrus]|uniref:Homeodomain-interacting protein kinase 3-like n=1 Tax=Scomber scombrus TaxID=13677 RepID=A0AAV1NVV9_SCOSC